MSTNHIMRESCAIVPDKFNSKQSRLLTDNDRKFEDIKQFLIDNQDRLQKYFYCPVKNEVLINKDYVPIEYLIEGNAEESSEDHSS